MELRLNIYTDKKCKVIEKTLTANDFELSTGVCEDVLRLIKVDQIDDLAALSEESQAALLLDIITANFDQFKDLLKNVFDDLTDDALSRTKLSDMMSVVAKIIKFSFATLFSAFKTDKRKN